jgi:nucleoid-associated protein YgaU
LLAQVLQHSRLRFGQFIAIDGFNFWDVLDLPEIPEKPSDITYQVQSGDRIDVLAEKFYGDPILWWVIAIANGLEILPTQLTEGSILRIPAPGYILHDFFTKNSVR